GALAVRLPVAAGQAVGQLRATDDGEVVRRAGPAVVEVAPVALGGIGRDRGGQGDLCRGGGIVSANRARPDSRRQALHDELVGEALGLHQQGNLLGRVVFLEWLGPFPPYPLVRHV